MPTPLSAPIMCAATVYPILTSSASSEVLFLRTYRRPPVRIPDQFPGQCPEIQQTPTRTILENKAESAFQPCGTRVVASVYVMRNDNGLIKQNKHYTTHTTMNTLTNLRSIALGMITAAAVFFSADNTATAQNDAPVAFDEKGSVLLQTSLALESAQENRTIGQTAEGKMLEFLEIAPKHGAALPERGESVSFYQWSVTSTQAAEETSANVIVSDVRYNGGFRLEMMPTGGSGACAGSTFTTAAADETPANVTMGAAWYETEGKIEMIPTGGSGTCAGSTFGE